ncbi:MAG: HAMP domain-containing histidine kinase [Chloroflexi bacterium]|nr:MAG: HAMP domain-containing histidine kinase [Chloroflexota bacterium]TME14136.1 MAG: HAMP domain-containing histidine kinase [Chloroflexota bacterium]TME18308.1 MAG: HAMP domain-containing histidine kinase [Chloroflexota bacterium]
MRAARTEEADLMSVLAHDLRTPLTAIRGAATLLVQAHDEIPADRVEQLLQVIDRQAANMADRIEDLLVAAKLGNGSLRVADEDVDLADLLADALDATRARAPDRRVRAPGKVDGAAVRGDSERVAQVLRVLLDNATRFSPSGTPIEVRLSAEGRLIRTEVRDRGAGLAAQDRERVFEPFERLDPAQPGTGMGLYIARGLVRAMGGEVGVEARSGGGSSFWFALPAASK